MTPDNEIIKELKKFVSFIINMLEDGKKSGSLWDVIHSLCEAGNYVARQLAVLAIAIIY